MGCGGWGIEVWPLSECVGFLLAGYVTNQISEDIGKTCLLLYAFCFSSVPQSVCFFHLLFLSPSVRLSVSLLVYCLFVHPSVCLLSLFIFLLFLSPSVRLSVSLLVCLPVRPSICLFAVSLHLSLHLFLSPSVCLSVSLPVCLPVCPSICLFAVCLQAHIHWLSTRPHLGWATYRRGE